MPGPLHATTFVTLAGQPSVVCPSAASSASAWATARATTVAPELSEGEGDRIENDVVGVEAAPVAVGVEAQPAAAVTQRATLKHQVECRQVRTRHPITRSSRPVHTLDALAPLERFRFT